MLIVFNKQLIKTSQFVTCTHSIYEKFKILKIISSTLNIKIFFYIKIINIFSVYFYKNYYITLL